MRLTGNSEPLAFIHIGLNDPFLVTRWNNSKLVSQSYVVRRVSNDIPARSTGSAIWTGFDPLKYKDKV